MLSAFIIVLATALPFDPPSVTPSATPPATSAPASPSVPGIEIQVQEQTTPIGFRIAERGPDGLTLGSASVEDAQSLQLYLKRAVKDQGAAAQVRFMVPKGCTLERVWVAVKAARAAGIERVSYYGCVPPGCGQLTGSSPTATRYDGTVFLLEELGAELAKRSQWC